MSTMTADAAARESWAAASSSRLVFVAKSERPLRTTSTSSLARSAQLGVDTDPPPFGACVMITVAASVESEPSGDFIEDIFVGQPALGFGERCDTVPQLFESCGHDLAPHGFAHERAPADALSRRHNAQFGIQSVVDANTQSRHTPPPPPPPAEKRSFTAAPKPSASSPRIREPP